MKEEEIIENNKLIAEFIGAYIDLDNEYNFTDIKFEVTGSEPKFLRFHNSWDWLMVVIDKIESMELFDELKGNKYKYYVTKITRQNFCILGGIKNTIIGCSIRNSDKKEMVYEGVVKFIKWYNLNKK